MSATINGVIETSSGDLLKAGYCNWSVDGHFDGGTQTYRTDVPCPPKVKGLKGFTVWHRWNGSAWVEVSS